jgi:ribulose-5-phosphate 4-epimerase/fuculose-1-phosphate aldolase
MSLDVLKADLCLAYHVLAHLGLDDHTYTHLSARVPGDQTFLIYPFGLRFEETQPSNLLRVSFDGTVLEGSEHQYNKTGYVIHSAVYRARADAMAAFHIHTPATVAVSATKAGLEPLSQWALHFYDQVAYHNYDALALSDAQGDALAHDLGDKNILLMRHHGALTVGKTLAEALFYIYHLDLACKTQVMARSMNLPLRKLDDAVCQKSVDVLLNFEQDLGRRDWLAWKRALGHRIQTTAGAA